MSQNDWCAFSLRLRTKDSLMRPSRPHEQFYKSRVSINAELHTAYNSSVKNVKRNRRSKHLLQKYSE